MTRLLRYAVGIGLIALGTAPLTPQQIGGQSPGPVFRVTADLVQLDAVVTDSKGRHVTGLNPDDFQILEDGKPQKITHFSYVPGTVTAGGPARVTPAPQKRSGKTPEAIPPPARALQPKEVQRTIVLIADDLGLAANDIVNVRNAMKSFVNGQMQPGDVVSVMTTSGGVGAMQQLTNDKRQLLALIDRIHYVPGRVGLTWYEPTNIGDGARAVQTASNARLNSIRAPRKAASTLGAVAYAIQGLSEMPGRKAIALFSDGASQSVNGLVELANRASVVLYTFDARGLVAFFLSAVDVCSSCAGAAGPAKIRAAEGQRQGNYVASQRILEELARGTGGIFFHDNNDLSAGLANAIGDMSSYYLLAYQPQRSDFDAAPGGPKFHKTEVKILRPGLHVRSRAGFLGRPDPPPVIERTSRPSLQPVTDRRARAQEALRKALFSPFQATGFPVQLSAFYSASTARDPKTGRRPALLRAMLAIDARGLTFNDTSDGRKELDLDIVGVAYGANNEVVTSSDKSFSAAMTPDEMNQIIASGLAYNLEVEILQPGPYQLRVAARDASSERTGSASAFVEIPDFNHPGIALSSVQLYDSDAKRNEELTRAGVLGAGSAVTRIFAQGAALQYDCTVYGPLIDGKTGKPDVDIKVDLVRGSEQILSGQPIPLTIPGGSSTAPIHATGEIKLPATLPPGDYALELSVYDRLEKKQQTAAQWVDFTLIK